MSEYNELVEKLASEIVAEVTESIEKEAGVKEMAGKAKAIAAKGINAATFGGIGQAKRSFAAAKRMTEEAKVHGGGKVPDSLKKYINSAKLRGVAGVAKASAVPAGLAGAGITASMLMKKKKDAAAEKAASILLESQLQKVAAEEAFNEAQLSEDAAASILNELGLNPEDVLSAILEEVAEEEQE